MKNFIKVLVLSSAFLTACVPDDSVLVTDDAGVVHKTLHYTKDTRGRDYFPMTIRATGEKQFIFDPKASAWAAYDANGNRVLTGSASGGMEFCEDVGKPCKTVIGTFKV